MANVKYAFVTGWYRGANPDSPNDEDRQPEKSPLAGKVIFRPNANYVLMPSGEPDPFTLLPVAFSADIDAEGYISHNGKRGIWLISNDTPANPKDWTYTVEFQLTNGVGGPPLRFGPFSYKFTESVDETDTSNDLTKLTPVTASGGVPMTQGVGVDHVAVEDGAFVFYMTDGTKQLSDPLPALEAPEPKAASYTGASIQIDPSIDLATISAIGPTEVTIADAVEGTQVVVHVAAGAPFITWSGVTVVGSIATDEAWVTLVKTTGGWSLIAPQPGGGSEESSGWIWDVSRAEEDVVTVIPYGDAPPAREEYDQPTFYKDTTGWRSGDEGGNLPAALERLSSASYENFKSLMPLLNTTYAQLSENQAFGTGALPTWGVEKTFTYDEAGNRTGESAQVTLIPGVQLQVGDMNGVPTLLVGPPPTDPHTGDPHPFAGRLFKLALEEVQVEQ